MSEIKRNYDRIRYTKKYTNDPAFRESEKKRCRLNYHFKKVHGTTELLKQAQQDLQNETDEDVMRTLAKKILKYEQAIQKSNKILNENTSE